MRATTILLLAVVSVAAAGCDEKLSELTGPTPSLQPTFSSIQHEIFDTTDSSGRVACVTCHNPQGRNFTAGLDLTSGTSYGLLVGVASREKPNLMRVAAGDPDNSYLIHKLEGHADIVGARMPRTNGPFLTPGQIAVIRRWIAIGAPNN